MVSALEYQKVNIEDLGSLVNIEDLGSLRNITTVYQSSNRIAVNHT
jgi:hypothetical protein